MDQSWTECTLPVPAEALDLVSDMLYTVGCIGINVEERELDTFTVPDPDAGAPAVYQIKAYFSAGIPVESLLNEICQNLQPEIPGLLPEHITVGGIQQEDWAEGWKQHFSTLRFGSRLTVRPTWEEEDDASDAVVTLDPGMAFGTGSHETTRLCLQTLADQYEKTPVPESVLDVGTGSGILAIAAAKLGATAVVGCEIDVDACRVAEENVILNRVVGQVEVTSRFLEEIDGSFDLVIANILAEENVRLADRLVARIAEGGTLILSGILKEKESFVCEGFSAFGLAGPEIRYENEWCCISYVKDRGA